ncbi:MAG: class I SAM-dependent methyltransferase [Nitrospira sp.]|nr:class I SAM-dependent methyltransferase [bacterium]MBL7048591.1 class I SAM-dependent methyltransferase [Nitrospira sp.]
MDNLHKSVSALMALQDEITDGSHQLYHRVVAAMHALCYTILDAEKNGCSEEEIARAVAPARELHSRSVFVKRLQEWPRQYPGDFETVEYICSLENKSLYGTVEYFIEEYALNSAIAQQHRNKLHTQSRIILDAVLNNERPVKILSVGCGGCRDIMDIKEFIIEKPLELVINDIDDDALKLSGDRLADIAGVQFISGNIIQAIRKVEALGPFDLIVTGGLFDHMSDKHIAFFLKHVKLSMLKPGGRLFFTNVVDNNPFRVWMEQLADWRLNYRTEEGLRKLVTDAGFSESVMAITKDETGLSFLVTLQN